MFKRNIPPIDGSSYKIIEPSNLQEIFSSVSKCQSFALNTEKTSRLSYKVTKQEWVS